MIFVQKNILLGFPNKEIFIIFSLNYNLLFSDLETSYDFSSILSGIENLSELDTRIFPSPHDTTQTRLIHRSRSSYIDSLTDSFSCAGLDVFRLASHPDPCICEDLHEIFGKHYDGNTESSFLADDEFSNR